MAVKALGPAHAVAAGAIGPPGRRTFYLQVDVGEDRRWFLLEKQQLAIMAARLLEVLASLGETERVEPPPIAEPDSVDFRVGEIVIGYADGRFTVALQPSVEEPEVDGVEFDAGFEVLGGMAVEATRVVAAGRPLCQFCNLPKDPGGHVCPASNGHRRARLDT